MTPVFTLVALESFAQHTLLILWHKVMVYADLAYLYDVPAKALNQAARWNLEPFPSDLMYQLTAKEKQGELERKISSHCKAIASLIDVIRQLMRVPDGSPRPIGLMADIK
ncbi:MAG: ORF6N domain-containing protein [Candidatus Nitrotoga sp. CP45]|nr:MAG: ORF6N domain-containing protein [Candidatus Nitrotoga sp. CP45]